MKMGAELRKKILEKLTIELLKTQGEMSDETGKLVEAYYNSLSDDISQAVGTIDDISAPFVIVVLETFAESIRKLFPGHDETIELIRELPRIQIIRNEEK